MTHFKDSTLHVDECGIIVHSIPPVADAYDKGWTSHHSVVPHSIDRKSMMALFVDHSNMIEYIFLPEESLLPRRIGEGIGVARPIIKSSAELKFKKGTCVLDVCAGLGAYSVAAMESGASKVYALDGSRSALKRMFDRLQASQDADELQLEIDDYTSNIVRVQTDINCMQGLFLPAKFDIVMMRYALMHAKNPYELLKLLLGLVRPGGRLCLNFFAKGCTSQATRKIRSHFLPMGHDYCSEFLSELGLDGRKNIDTDKVVRILRGEESLDQKFSKSVTLLQEMSEDLSLEDLMKVVHYEDMTTAILHNLDIESVEGFLIDLGVTHLRSFYAANRVEAHITCLRPKDLHELRDIEVPTLPAGTEFNEII